MLTNDEKQNQLNHKMQVRYGGKYLWPQHLGHGSKRIRSSRTSSATRWVQGQPGLPLTQPPNQTNEKQWNERSASSTGAGAMLSLGFTLSEGISRSRALHIWAGCCRGPVFSFWHFGNKRRNGEGFFLQWPSAKAHREQQSFLTVYYSQG